MPHGGEKIAETSFIYGDEPVHVTIYKPVKKWLDGDEFTCWFEISCKSNSYSAESVGYDSMQSLILALSIVGSYIEDSGNYSSFEIAWPGGQLLFPKLSDFS